MRSLFVKIFLWFWLAITIVIAALALVTWLYPYSAVPSDRLPDRLHELQVRGALAVYELQGPIAFERHRHELETASHLRTYFLDDAGIELSGQAVPGTLREFAREHREEIARGERVMAGQPARLAIPVTSDQGRRYLALVEGDRPGFDRGGGGGRDPRPPPEPGPGRGPGPPLPGAHGPGFELLVPVHVLLLRLLAVVLAAGLGCYALARYLTSPVRQLQDAVRQLAAGDLGARVGARVWARRDEIGALGRDFDRMARQVEALLIAQRRLLQDVSHELRSPLARLSVALELANRAAGPAASAALARVEREADHLNRLIEQLLVLARFEGGAVPLQHTGVDLRALLTDIVLDAEFEAAARNRRVRVVRCDACAVTGVPDLLRSAIENVMRNALRYTPEGSEVEVTLIARPEGAGGSATIEIRDRGPGVPDEALERIFEPFYRVSTARDRTSGGSGLGLAIADRAIRAHGGTVRAANAPGGGLAVQIELPLAAPPSS